MKRSLLSFLIASQTLFAAGFSSQIKDTFALAKKQHKPVLISFYGIWCPPCNELEETVFESRGFLERAKSFELLKVDADAKSSWHIKSRYKVGGYPTVLFANPSGEELYRITGYETPKQFFRVMDLVIAAKGKGLASACRSHDAEDLWRCGVICSERKDKACADKAFASLESSLKPGSVRFDVAKTYAADNAETPDLKRRAYETLLASYPQSPLALQWAESYFDTTAGHPEIHGRKDLVEKALANFSKSLNDPRLELYGISQNDLLQMRADLLDRLGRHQEAKAAWKEAADRLAALAKTLPKDSPARGFTIDRIECLESAGDFPNALALANEYRDKFPDEFTFHYIAASILDRQKRYPEALSTAKQAYRVSYGDNKIRAAILLVRLYGTQSDKMSAKKIFDEVTSQIKPNASLDIRTHRYLKQLAVAMQKIAG